MLSFSLLYLDSLMFFVVFLYPQIQDVCERMSIEERIWFLYDLVSLLVQLLKFWSTLQHGAKEDWLAYGAVKTSSILYIDIC